MGEFGPMKKIERFVIWICSKFNQDEILNIIDQLIEISNDKNFDKLPKDNFKEKHPNYRDFSVDPQAPLTYSEVVHRKKIFHYKKLLAEYKTKNNKPLKPVKVRDKKK